MEEGSRRGLLGLCNVKGTAASDLENENLGCTCRRWSTSNEMNQGLCQEELVAGKLNFWEWYGFDGLSSVMGMVHLSL